MVTYPQRANNLKKIQKRKQQPPPDKNTETSVQKGSVDNINKSNPVYNK